MIEAGYRIFHPDSPDIYYDFDKGGAGLETVSTTNEDNRLELKNFGKFPIVYHAGETDYESFDLTGVFIPELDDGGFVVKKAKEIYDDFKAMINLREPLRVINSMGEELICDIEIKQRISPKLYVEHDMDFMEVTIGCTEIDEI